MGDQRNFLLAIALTMAVYFLWLAFFAPEPPTPGETPPEAEASSEGVGEHGEFVPQSNARRGAPGVDGTGMLSRDEALGVDTRVAIDTPALRGSLNLRGARLDDLQLLRYRAELAEDSPPVTLLHPTNARLGFHAYHGWQAVGADGPTDLPGPSTEWRVVEGATLTPETPVRLRYDSADGLVFLRTLMVDEDYLFTIEDEVRNESGEAVELQYFGAVQRNELPDDLSNFMILHEGMVGVFDKQLEIRKYKKMRDVESVKWRADTGWLGITDKYWMTAIVPPAGLAFEGEFLAQPTGRGKDDARYYAYYLSDPVVVRSGAGGPPSSPIIEADGPITSANSVAVTARVYAGAKRSGLMREYEESHGIPRLEDGIDWGMLWFLMKPFYAVLHFFGVVTGNFGIAILVLTVLVKAAFFPLADASYKAMARMKALQPKMQELRERHKDDPKRQQQELVQLYQREKVNPLAGCLPLLPQMVVFFALYKTLFITIEMRHAPFFGWIQDLSAPDPTNMWNLFGLLPYDPSGWAVLGGFLAIGLWPLIMGLSMAAIQTLNPPPPDPMQAKIFAFMPVIFTIILAPFAAGLVIYWTWNNILSFAQQYLIMRRQGVDTPIGKFIANRVADARAGKTGDQLREMWRRAREGVAGALRRIPGARR